jgi:hypothetical protein
MKSSLTIRYAVIAVLLTAGWLGMLTRDGLISCYLLFLAVLLFPDDLSDLTDTAMRRWLRGLCIRLAVILLIVGGIVYFHRFDLVDAVARFFHHTVVILLLWLVSLWTLYRHWRKQRGLIPNLVTGCKLPSPSSPPSRDPK